jgi:TRAP-type mannitol/chloroaromatic compound transport system permease small subunit
VIGLAIATNLTSIIPFLGLVIFFLMPFIMMIYIAIYENAIGNPLTTTNEA